jgi:hypothetical protein
MLIFILVVVPVSVITGVHLIPLAWDGDILLMDGDMIGDGDMVIPIPDGITHGIIHIHIIIHMGVAIAIIPGIMKATLLIM